MASELYIAYNAAAATLYSIVRRLSDGKVWNDTDQVFESWDSLSLTDYVIDLTDQGGDLYVGDFPSAISAGTYAIKYHLQGVIAPDDTDTILGFNVRQWDGASLSSSSTVTLSPYALTTLESVKRYLRITDSSSDTLLTELINAMSGRIERETGRLFKARDYRHRINGTRQDRITVPQYPLIEVTRLSYGEANAISIQFTGTAIRALVQVTETGLQLRSMNSSGTETETNLAFSTYKTNSTLRTAIAAVSGWTATLYADGPSPDLNPMGGINAKSQVVMLGYPDQDVRQNWIDRETGIISYQTPDYVAFGYQASNGYPMPSYDTRAPYGFQYLLIEYRAGYETIPDDLAMLANELVAEGYHIGRRDTSIKSESLGDYSYTLSDLVTMTDLQWQRLSRWSNVKMAKA